MGLKKGRLRVLCKGPRKACGREKLSLSPKYSSLQLLRMRMRSDICRLPLFTWDYQARL